MYCPHCKKELVLKVEALFVAYDFEQIEILKCEKCDTFLAPYHSKLSNKIDTIKDTIEDLQNSN